MVKQARYAKTVFVFNDNVVDGANSNPADGGGSAGVRTLSWKYTSESSFPRAIGIPTGWSVCTGGFKAEGTALEPFAARAITLAVERLVLACIAHDVREVIFSCDKNDPTCRRLGSTIFSLNDILLRFIEKKLHDLPRRVVEGSKFTRDRIDELEEQTAYVGTLQMRLFTSSPKRERLQDDARFVTLPNPMPSSSMHYVGVASDGGHVYERRGPDTTCMVKKARPSPYFRS